MTGYDFQVLLYYFHTFTHGVISNLYERDTDIFEISFWYVRGARRDMCVNRFESRKISKNFWKRKEIECTPIQVSSSQSSYTMQEFDEEIVQKNVQKLRQTTEDRSIESSLVSLPLSRDLRTIYTESMLSRDTGWRPLVCSTVGCDAYPFIPGEQK